MFNLAIKHLFGGSDGKASACNAGDPGSILGLGRSPGEGNGIPFQYSCLENSMDRGAHRATVHGVTKSGHYWSDLAQHSTDRYNMVRARILTKGIRYGR